MTSHESTLDTLEHIPTFEPFAHELISKRRYAVDGRQEGDSREPKACF